MRFSTLTTLPLRTCFALFAVVGDGPLTRASFTAKGLKSEDDLTDLFVGNFNAVAFDRGSLTFSSLFESYLEAFSSQCGAYLPANKVEMTIQVCAEEPAPIRLPNEPPPLPHACMLSKTVSLGYADPALYAAKKQLDADQAANQGKDLLSMARSLRPAIGMFQAKTDMEMLVRINTCGGPGLRRFRENLVLFAEASVRGNICVPDDLLAEWSNPAPGSKME